MKIVIIVAIILSCTIAHMHKNSKSGKQIEDTIRRQALHEKRTTSDQKLILHTNKDFKILDPYTIEQGAILENSLNKKNPQAGAGESYYPGDAKAAIANGQPVLVRDNLRKNPLKGTAYDQYAEVEKNLLTTAEKNTRTTNQLDPLPYYDTVQNVQNIYNKNNENIFAVPIEVGRDHVDEIAKINKRLARKKRNQASYYDPTYDWAAGRNKDKFQEILAKDALERSKPQTETLHDFKKKKDDRARFVRALLGKTDIPKPTRNNVQLANYLKDQANKETAKRA